MLIVTDVLLRLTLMYSDIQQCLREEAAPRSPAFVVMTK